jgi:hypothetical protein
MLVGNTLSTYPVTFVLNADGEITFKVIGVITYDDLKAQIEAAN